MTENISVTLIRIHLYIQYLANSCFIENTFHMSITIYIIILVTK